MVDEIMDDATPDVDTVADVVPETVSDSQPSADDIISKALDEHYGSEDAPSDGRARDQKGRFAAKTESDTAEAPDAGLSDAAPVESAEQPQQNAQAEPVSEGHFRGWSPEMRTAFQCLAPEVQHAALPAIQALNQAFQDRLVEAQSATEQASPLVTAVQPHIDRIRASGHTPAAYVHSVLAVDHALQFGTYADKTKLLAELAQNIGVPIQIQQPDEWADPLSQGGTAYPVIHDLQNQNRMLQQQLAAIQSSLQQQQTAQTSSQLSAFAATKNTDGTPKYPHFERVRAAMGQLMASGQAQTLEDAYQAASKPIDDAIAAEVARQVAAAEAKRKAAVDKARQARPIVRSGHQPGGTTAAKDLDSIIGASLDQHGFA